MDEYRVEVRGRTAREVTLHLSRRNREATLPLGKSFADMLLTDESSPGRAAWIAIRDREVAVDEDFWLAQHVSEVAIEEILAPRPETDADDGDAGSAVVRIRLDRDGLLDHLEPGSSWGTTAYDENGDCLHFDFGAPDASPRRWSR